MVYDMVYIENKVFTMKWGYIMNDFKDQMFWGIIFIMVFAFLFVPLPLVAYIFLGFFAVLCKLPRLHGDDNEDRSDDE